MAALLLLLVFLLALGVPAVVALNSFAGPYIAYGKRFYQCTEGCGTKWDWRARVSHFNPYKPREPQRITGYISMSNGSGLTDALWMRVILDSRSNNQWKENAFVVNLPSACSAWREHIPDVFRVVFQGAGMRGTCRVPPGNYSFVNQPIRWVFPHFPTLPYGEYRFRMTGGPLNSDAPVACACIECAVIPKI